MIAVVLRIQTSEVVLIVALKVVIFAFVGIFSIGLPSLKAVWKVCVVINGTFILFSTTVENVDEFAEDGLRLSFRLFDYASVEPLLLHCYR